MSGYGYGFDDFFAGGGSGIVNGGEALPLYYSGLPSPNFSHDSRDTAKPLKKRSETVGNESSYSALGTAYTLPMALSRPINGRPSLTSQNGTSRPVNDYSDYGDAFDFLGSGRSLPTSATRSKPSAATSKPADIAEPNWSYGLSQCANSSLTNNVPELPPITRLSPASKASPTAQPPSQVQPQRQRTVSAPSVTAPAAVPHLPAAAPSRRRSSSHTELPASQPPKEPTNALQEFRAFHEDNQRQTPPPPSPKKDGRGIAGVPSFRTWQMTTGRNSASTSQPVTDPPREERLAMSGTVLRCARRQQNATTTQKPSPITDIDGIVSPPADDSPAPANWVAATTAHRRSKEAQEQTNGRGGRREPRVSISLSSKEMTHDGKRNSSLRSGPLPSGDEPVDRRRRYTTHSNGPLESSLMPQERLRNGRLSLSGDLRDVTASYSPPQRDPLASSMMPGTRAVMSSPQLPGAMGSLMPARRLRQHGNALLDSVSQSDESGALISMVRAPSNGSLSHLQQSVNGTYAPQLDASHRVDDLSSDEDLHDNKLGGSMFRRSHTRRASASMRSTARSSRLKRTDSHTWLAGLESSVTVRKQGSFTYLARIPTADDGSSDDEGELRSVPDDMGSDLSFHTSSEDDEESDVSEEAPDEEEDEASTMNVAPAARRRSSSGARAHRGQSDSGPQMGEWRPRCRAPQPQPNLPLHVGRGGCLSINPMARTPQPPVAMLLGFNMDHIARRVPSPDLRFDQSGSPQTLVTPGMMMGPGMPMMPGRVMF